MSLRRVASLLSLALLLALSGAAPLAAQAVLTEGSAAQGELRKGDLKLDDDTYADLWRFTGRAGQSVRVTMHSGDFDAYLVVGYYDAAGEFKQLDSDDDGAEGTDAMVELTLPRDGEYVARANTLEEGETGSYTLLYESANGAKAAPLAASGPGDRPAIAAGQTLAGELKSGDHVETDGTFSDFYVYSAQAGERATVTLRSSDFDAYLAIRAPDGSSGRPLEANDDGAGGHDSRISYTFPSAGYYWLVANTLTKSTGRYTISVESSAAAPSSSTGTTSSLVIDKINGQGGNRPSAPAPEAASTRSSVVPIQPGQTVRGDLSRSDELNFDNTYVDTYGFHGRRGQKVKVLMLSPDYGSYVLVGKAPASGVGREFSSIETEGAMPGKEAQLEITLPEEGDYWIRANSFGVNTGSYVLTFQLGN